MDNSRGGFTFRGRLVASIFLIGMLLCAVEIVAAAQPKFGGKVHLHGVLSREYLAARPAGVVDALMAVPVLRGQLTRQNLDEAMLARVQPGGSFSLFLSTETDWLIVLINTRATGPGRWAGQMAFRIKGDASTLLLLPTSRAIAPALNLGRIEMQGGFAVTRRPLDARSFSMTPEQLAALARSDDHFASVKNLVINSGGGSGYTYSLRPDFHWDCNYAETRDAYSGIFFGYRSYNFQLDSDDPEPTMAQICGTGGVAKVPAELFPPEATEVFSTIPGLVYTFTVPIANNNVSCSTDTGGFTVASDEDFFATDRHGAVSFTFGRELRTQPIPAGYWLYKVNGVLKAQFDLAVTSPVTEDGRVNGVAPMLRLNTDAEGRILSADVAWVRQASTPEGFEIITDLSELSLLMESAEIFFENTHGGLSRYESVSFDPTAETNVSPANPWYYGFFGDAGEQAESVGIFYSSGGLGFYFTFQRFVYPDGIPAAELPIPSYEQSGVTRGQRFDCAAGHTGLDFGFTDWPAPGSFSFHDIVSPFDGIVQDCKGHYMSNGQWLISLTIAYNREWRALLAFEPCNNDESVRQQQTAEIAVHSGQVVRQGQVIGRLVVPSSTILGSFGPHVHWGLDRLDPATGSGVEEACPRSYCTAGAASSLDLIYTSVEYGPLLPVCQDESCPYTP